MTGNFIDIIRFSFKRIPNNWKSNINLISTDYGKIRILDTKGNKPVIINVPDGPNVIEHQTSLINELSKNYRVICFEYPGLGFSYPNSKYDYSFEKGARLILNVIDILKIDRASLLFSCSNGFYAIKSAELFPEKFNHLFLSQTPSVHSMVKWAEKSIPNALKYPIIGQLVNSFTEKKFANIWYKYALPKETNITQYQEKAINSIKAGGCFCLSGLVQALIRDKSTTLSITGIPTTLVWGMNDFTHRETNTESIKQHIPNCEIIEFDKCGHFPELEHTVKFVKLINERLTI